MDHILNLSCVYVHHHSHSWKQVLVHHDDWNTIMLSSLLDSEKQPLLNLILLFFHHFWKLLFQDLLKGYVYSQFVKIFHKNRVTANSAAVLYF